MIPSPAKPTLSAISPTPGFEHAHVPLHFAYKDVVASEHETTSFALKEQGMQRAIFGEAEQSFGGGPCPVDHQLYLSPVHPRRALGEPEVWDRHAVPDEHHGGDLRCADAGPAGSCVGLAGLVVGPEPRRQVDAAVRGGFHEGGDVEVGPEGVLRSE